MRIYKGDIFYADLTPVVGCEQGGIRPILIVQNNIGNRYSPTVIVAAITSRTEKNPLPTPISRCAASSMDFGRIPLCCWSRCEPLTVPACVST